MTLTPRFFPVYIFCVVAIFAWFFFAPSYTPKTVLEFKPPSTPDTTAPPEDDGRFNWALRKERFPVSSMIPLPTGTPPRIPKIQYDFKAASEADAVETRRRRDAVKAAFNRAWEGYKSFAWMRDELAPISGTSRNHFGGWAATLVDSLDTLWIMDKMVDFDEAVADLKDIDFSTTEDEDINTFETTIRYLGGLLSAYDLSLGKYPGLLEKALELGHFLYAAFDTHNRMPITRWKWQLARDGEYQEATSCLVAEIGSLSLEFTRLSQLTGDPKFFDAIQRISDRFEAAQPISQLPGMWPVVVNPNMTNLGNDTFFTLGAMADSLYEYLPKQYMLLGGSSHQPQYKKLYETSIDVAKRHLFFRPMTKEENPILISGNLRVNSPTDLSLDPQGQHLSCYAGGMLGIGSKIFNRPDDLLIGRKLVNGCIWAYHAMPTGIMPETFHAFPCADMNNCPWDANNKEIMPQFPGFTEIGDSRYILRPEAIESIFILYRITGDESLRDDAWRMFQAIEDHTKTEFGSAALDNVTVVPPPKSDSMESFWTAETLKYFYLIFSDPDVVSLDKYVFNTEAHPFKRPS